MNALIFVEDRTPVKYKYHEVHMSNSDTGFFLTAYSAEQRGSQDICCLFSHWTASSREDQPFRRRSALAASLALKLPYFSSRATDIIGGSNSIKERNGKVLVLRYHSSVAQILRSQSGSVDYFEDIAFPHLQWCRAS